jgi:hypothetical protein
VGRYRGKHRIPLNRMIYTHVLNNKAYHTILPRFSVNVSKVHDCENLRENL